MASFLPSSNYIRETRRIQYSRFFRIFADRRLFSFAFSGHETNTAIAFATVIEIGTIAFGEEVEDRIIETDEFDRPADYLSHLSPTFSHLFPRLYHSSPDTKSRQIKSILFLFYPEIIKKTFLSLP
jgi:hypothetical protein